MASFEVTLVIEAEDHVTEQEIYRDVRASIRNASTLDTVDITVYKYEEDEL